MKNFTKYAAVGLVGSFVGYFIGLYVLKYMALKTCMKPYAEDDEDKRVKNAIRKIIKERQQKIDE